LTPAKALTISCVCEENKSDVAVLRDGIDEVMVQGSQSGLRHVAAGDNFDPFVNRPSAVAMGPGMPFTMTDIITLLAVAAVAVAATISCRRHGADFL
jgi:hypothetical protein